MARPCVLTVALTIASLVLVPGIGLTQASTNENAKPPRQSPQLTPRTETQRQRNYLRAHRIRLDVQVLNSSGIPFSPLSKSDFTILDNGQPRPLTSFAVAGPESADSRIILVLDEVNNSARQVRHFEKEIAGYLLKQDKALPHPVAIGRFSSGVLKVGKSTRDRDSLLFQLTSRQEKTSPGCIEDEQHSESLQPPWLMGGGASRSLPDSALDCMNQRFVSSISGLYLFAEDQNNDSERTIVIWIGPGWPTLSNPEFKADTPDLKQNFFDRLVGTSTALLEARITLDAVSSTSGYDALFHQAGTKLIHMESLTRATSRLPISVCVLSHIRREGL